MAFILILALASLPFGTALNWDDFTNNLATDLAPLIVLFGEQVTKQFLSESLSIWDNVIFAMAPLGILTAVVSAIRVCGSSSLRAFIGRAQESPGTAEVELLSCTSETTSELWHAGGIARVFGTPQILEVVRSDTTDKDYQDKDEKDENEKYVHKDCTAGIDLFNQDCGNKAWLPVKGERDLEKCRYHRPNLSLNIGIKRQAKRYTYMAAGCGIILQTGVLVFAGLATHQYPSRFGMEPDGKPAENYAFPFMIVGTVLLCFGMFFCAYIIEQSTNEVHYKKQHPSKMYWVQPGGQKIGDQMFASFVGVSEDSKYIVSSRAEDHDKFNGLLWVTVIATIIGFIVQFVGLRAMHSSIIMAQLAATLLMSIIRAGLRTQRVAETRDLITLRKNHGKDDRDIVQGHELDFLAMEIEKVTLLFISRNQEGRLSKMSIQTPPTTPNRSEPAKLPNIGPGTKALKARARLARLTSDANYHLSWKDLRVRQIASQLQTAIEGVMELLSAKLEGADAKIRQYHWPINIWCASKDEQFLLRLWKEGLIWRADCSELEAIIGMWAWSLLRRKSARTHRTDTSNIRLVAATPDPGLGEAEMWYKSWIQRRLELKPPGEIEGVNPTVWAIEGRPLFGCHPKDQKTDKMLFVETQNSTLKMCAQDVFIAFLRAALESISDIGGKITIRTAFDRQDALLLKNSQIEEMANCFENSELGSREDAYMCIIPLLMRESKLPGMVDVLTAVRTHVQAHKNKGRFKEAEELLQWICSSSRIPESNKPYPELAELYRTAMRHEKQDIRTVGFNGVCNLLKEAKKLHSESAISKLACQYGWIGLRIAAEMRDEETRNRLKDCGATEDVVLHYEDNRKLCLWAEDNNSTVMRYLIGKKDCDVDAEDANGRTSLSWVAIHGNIDIATLLLEKSADRNHRDRNGRTPLSYAAENGHHSLIGILLEGDTISLNVGAEGKTPLILAAKNGHVECVRVLLKIPGIRVNIRGPGQFDKCGALEAAIAGNHPEVAELLVARNADYYPRKLILWAGKGGHQRIVDLVMEKGMSYGELFQIATEQGFPKVVESLIKRKKVDFSKHGKGALERAIKNGHQEVTELLIKEVMSREGLLREAARRGHYGIVKLLVGNGEGLTEYSELVGAHDTSESEEALELAATAGHTAIVALLIGQRVPAQEAALIGAVQNGRQEMVEILIKGMDINNYGGGALEVAAGAGNDKIVELLIHQLKGENIQAHGRGALLRAAIAGHKNIVKLLIEKGVHLHNTVFEEARRKGRWGVVEVLIENGVNLEQYGRDTLRAAAVAGEDRIVDQLIKRGVDFDGVLQQAAELGQQKIVKRLLEAQADVNAGEVPALALAAKSGDRRTVELLINHGADINAKDGSALKMAVKWDRLRVAELLIKKGNRADVNAMRGELLKLAKGSQKMKDLLMGNGIIPASRTVRFEEPDTV